MATIGRLLINTIILRNTVTISIAFFENFGCRDRLQPGLHATFFAPFFPSFKNGLNEFLQCCSHMTLKYVKKIKGVADKNGAKNGPC